MLHLTCRGVFIGLLQTFCNLKICFTLAPSALKYTTQKHWRYQLARKLHNMVCSSKLTQTKFRTTLQPLNPIHFVHSLSETEVSSKVLHICLCLHLPLLNTNSKIRLSHRTTADNFIPPTTFAENIFSGISHTASHKGLLTRLPHVLLSLANELSSWLTLNCYRLLQQLVQRYIYTKPGFDAPSNPAQNALIQWPENIRCKCSPKKAP